MNEQDTYITVCKILNTKNTETQTDKIIHVINHIRTCRKQISTKLRTADIFAFPCGFVFSIHVQCTYREIILSAFYFSLF